MKILLIQLNDKLIYAGYKRNQTKRIPLGLTYVASSMIKEGHNVEILDASLNDLNIEQITNEVFNRCSDKVGITCTTPLFPQLVEVVTKIKKRNKNIKVIIGGPHVSALPQSSLIKSGADEICIGNYEKVKLDDVPFPARNLLKYNRYVDYARGVLTPQTSIITSRGCIGRCGFCNAGSSVVELRSVKNVLDELEEIYTKYCTNLVFYDDSFTVIKKRVIAICKGMVERKLNFKYQVQLRLDQIDDEVMEWLVRSGCEQVGPGIESGNIEIIKSIGKNQTPDFMLKKCKIIKKYSVKMRCSYIMGWIDETEEQIKDTLKLAKEINADENAFSIATPYPGTRMWGVALQKGLVSEDMDFSSFLYYHKIGCNLSKVPSERLLELHELAYQEVGNRGYNLR